MTVHTAQLRYLRMTPRKVRLVADKVKGLSVNEAEAQLMYERRRAGKPLLKLLRSAVAGAKQAKRFSSDLLVVTSIRVDQGSMLKRYLPRARGMTSPIQKKMSHVTLTLGEDKKARPARFTVVVKKKVKLPPGETKRVKKHIVDEPASSRERRQKGFFRKLFQRKAV